MPVGIVSLYTFRGKTSTLYRTFPGAALFTVCEKKLQTADPAPACAPTFSRTGTAPNALYHKPGLFEMVILIIPESISILYIMLRFVCRARNPSAERPQKKFGKCRFVNHFGHDRKKELLWEKATSKAAWGGCWCDFGGQLAAHQSRRANRRNACRRAVVGLLYGCVQPFRYVGEYKDE